MMFKNMLGVATVVLLSGISVAQAETPSASTTPRQIESEKTQTINPQTGKPMTPAEQHAYNNDLMKKEKNGLKDHKSFRSEGEHDKLPPSKIHYRQYGQGDYGRPGVVYNEHYYEPDAFAIPGHLFRGAERTARHAMGYEPSCWRWSNRLQRDIWVCR